MPSPQGKTVMDLVLSFTDEEQARWVQINTSEGTEAFLKSCAEQRGWHWPLEGVEFLEPKREEPTASSLGESGMSAHSGSYSSGSSGSSGGGGGGGVCGCIALIAVVGALFAWKPWQKKELAAPSPAKPAPSQPVDPTPSPAKTQAPEAQPAGPSAETLVESAIEAKQAGDLALAETRLREAVALEPDNIQAHLALAWTLVGLDKRDEALEQFGMVTQLEPSGAAKDEAQAAIDRIAQTGP